MQQVYDEITNGEKIDFDTFSKIISRLRSGDHRQRELSAKLKLLEAQIAENERREEERRAALKAISKKSVGKEITPEFLNEVQKAMGLI